MKQTAKRILSMTITLLMLVSLLSVFSYAASNYVRDEEYYNTIIDSTVVVNKGWVNLSESDTVTYTFRGRTITESYLPNKHYSSIQAAYDALKKFNDNPAIIVTGGIYTESVTISGDITILGANAGIDPNTKDASNPETPWTLNTARTNETTLKGIIDVAKNVLSDVEIDIDGVTLGIGFAYVDAGSRTTSSRAVLENSIVEAAGSTTYGKNTAVNSVFYFSSTVSSNVNIKNVRATDMNASSIVGDNVSELVVDGLFYTNSQYPALSNVDATTNINPEYVVKNSMFYNNNSAEGVININHSIHDSTTRTSTDIEIFGCYFIDGPDTELGDSAKNNSPIKYTVVGSKNKINIHDNTFKGGMDYNASPLGLVYSSSSYSSSLIDNIKFNQNKLYGYFNLNETTGHSGSTRFNFNGNFFANSSGVQCDPVFPSDASVRNIKVDYFWLDSAMTFASSNFYLKSTGIPNYNIDNTSRMIEAMIDYGTKYDINLVPESSDVTYTLYDSTKKNIVTSIDSASLVSGNGKNIYYAVGKCSKIPDYTFEYTVIVSTYNPSQVDEFNVENTYLYNPQVANLSAGSTIYATWDGMSYGFTVGKNVFATVAEIIEICDTVPTIIFPAGTYTENIVITGSAILLGAKHGINPNIPQFEDPDIEWAQNPLRIHADQESVFENCVVSISMNAVDASVIIDGFTFGSSSAFCDKGEGVTSYTTTTLKNIIIDGAGGMSWSEGNKNENLSTIFSFGGASDNYVVNHKDVRVINLRMTGQGNYCLLGDYFESVLLDGVYIANNNSGFAKSELAAPKDQNFYMEIRNSCFYKNITTSYYFILNFNSTDSAKRTSNRFVLDNNIFYNTSTNANGIVGVRFTGSKDSLKFVNNIFITSTAGSIIPGNTNWFLGKSGKDKVGNIEDCQIVSDIVFRFNRFIKCITAVDSATCKDGTLWDYSYNYFASSYSKTAAGSALKKRSGSLAVHSTCDYYYKDWDLTVLNDTDEQFATELKYSINGKGVLNGKTYTDTVSLSDNTYDFGIKLETRQAKYGIYSDAACTQPVEEPVAIVGGENVFYIKFSSYDNSNTEVYTAKITRPFGTEAKILRAGKYEVTGTAVNASVPIGTTTMQIPVIQVSDGAFYKIYNDKNCTSEFNGNEITGINASPSAKYIKVTSGNGATTKVYSFTYLQAENDQAFLSNIENAKRVSTTAFTAEIPANLSYFNLYPEYSDGASIEVSSNGIKVLPSLDGGYLIDGISSSKNVDITVTSAKEISKTYTLTVSKNTSSCEISYILNMVTHGDDKYNYSAKTDKSTYNVIAYLENPLATYKVYKDAACTDVCENNIVSLTDYTIKAYLKVTSADGKSTKVYNLNFETSTPSKNNNQGVVENYYTVTGATPVSEGLYYVDIGNNATNYDFKIEIKDENYDDTSYRVFSNATFTTPVGLEAKWNEVTPVKISAKTTNLYVKVWVKQDNISVKTDIVKVIVNSNRDTVSYKDTDKMSSWAVEHIKYLNENGYGYFVGDSDGNFNPTSNITRFEVAAIAVRLLGVDTDIYNSIVIPFQDNIPDWAKKYVQTCYKLEIMNGKSVTTFDGTAPTTRQELAKIIVSAVAFAEGETDDAPTIYTNNQAEVDADFNSRNFVDTDKIAPWANAYVRLAVSRYGLINGASSNGKMYVNPLLNVTRQEVAVILANYSGYSK